ncbi:breast carcinoma-amplified sequence 1 isoform X2 [Clarias gariepinus]|uniref:breast carcinoma-amplified sequence 1 isoform X2 n=1 Tax=Clarias gariepinus TaxID=13013 RepID=UPI00234DE09D|nr:breast carcinoma-amplified sequence 1 isoform X2 [Clarias gariepinus]
MFKKKSELVFPGPEANVSAELQTDSQIPKPTPASVDINGIQVKAPTVSVETSGIQLNSLTVSAESSTPAKDTPKQAGTPNVFNKMFKKKSGLLSLETEANVSADLQTDSQIPKPTPASVDINGIQVKAPTVSVETSGIQVSGVTVSAESSTPAKDTPKQAGTPNVFNKMFKKKSELVFPGPEANVSAELQTDSQIPKPTPASVDINGIQVKAPTVSVETSGIQVSGVTVSAESSTPAKDTPKQAGTPNVFNKMFKKKSELVFPGPEANVSAELQTNSQIPKPTPASVDINGIQVKAPTVSVETSGIQLNSLTVSAESSTPAKDTPKQAGTPNVFNKMFKKKSGLLSLETEANVSAELQTDSQIPKPTPASVDINGIQVKAPTVSVETSGIQVSGVTVSAESSTPAKDTPKQAGTPNVFNKMFKKKSELVFPGPEANVSAELQTDSQIPKPTPASVDANGIQVKAPTVSVETSGIQVSGVTVSAESSTPAKDTSKQAGTSNVFNKMFKKKSGLPFLETEANVSAELQTDSQIPKPTPASVDINGIQVKAPTVSVETSGIQLNSLTVSAESSTPAKDTPKQAGTPNVFNKMFKKKSGLLSLETEANVSADLQTDSQIPKPTPASVDINGIQVKAPTVSVETSGIQVSGVTVSAESSTPAKDTPKQAGTPNVFNKMFKKKSELVFPGPEANVSAELQTDSQIPKPTPASVDANGIQVKAPTVSVETSGIQVSGVTVSAESSTPAKDTSKQAGTPNMFNKMFKKNSGLLCFEPEANVAAELAIVPKVQTDSQIPEPTDIKASTQPEKQPQGEDPTEVTQDSTQPEQTGTEENSVMNFFKTLVSSTKTTKEATPSPDVSKEQQSHKETPPAPAANLQEASKIPPPPPPAPPKMESKAEPAVKKEEAPVAEAAAGLAKEPETPSKAKTKDSPFGKLFRTKSAVKEEAKPVGIQVDPSKTSTLEAGAKPEPPPAPKPEDKKAEKKPSPFANLLKPKVLLGQVSSRIHAAASSVAAGISLGAGGAATESKKEAAAAPPAPAEAGPNTKAKEEPKPAAAPAGASSDNKSVGSTDNSSPSGSRKLEKRNSIHLFFKNLGQKRHSDAGVQTEPVAPEKAK